MTGPRQRGRFVLAQLGRKPGRAAALAGLLTAADLPGPGWRVLDERTWRTGTAGPQTAWGERARQAGSLTAWRSFQAGGRTVWVQTAPLASAADAQEAVAAAGAHGLANLRTPNRVVREHEPGLAPFPGADAVWGREQHTAGPAGTGTSLLLAAATGTWFLALTVAGTPPWNWDDAALLGTRQADRLTAAGS